MSPKFVFINSRKIAFAALERAFTRVLGNVDPVIALVDRRELAVWAVQFAGASVRSHMLLEVTLVGGVKLAERARESLLTSVSSEVEAIFRLAHAFEVAHWTLKFRLVLVSSDVLFEVALVNSAVGAVLTVQLTFT